MHLNPQPNFCLHCGNALSFGLPDGDSHPRHHCATCGYIHYINPKPIAGTLPIYQGKILLCKRAIHPQRGLWTLPAGFMESEETVEAAAKRETWEEARAKVNLVQPIATISAPHIDQIHHFFLAMITNDDFKPGPESQAVQLVEYKDINWDQLAFSTIYLTLNHFFSELTRCNLQLDELMHSKDWYLKPLSQTIPDHLRKHYLVSKGTDIKTPPNASVSGT